MKRLFALLFGLSLGACGLADVPRDADRPSNIEGWPPTRSLEGPIQSVTRPTLTRMSTMQVKNLRTGQTDELRVTRFGNGVRVQETDGCTWTRAIDWFAPSDSFAGCGTSKNWHTAQAQVEREGSLFPLRVGNRAVYQRDAVSWNGRTSSRRTECEVIDTAEVLRPGGATPAYVVRCDDGRVTRTTWYAPVEGPIAYHEERQGRGVRDAWIRIN